MPHTTSLKAKLLILVVLAVGSAQAIVTGLSLWQETDRYAATKRETLLADAHVLAAAVAQASARNDRSAIFQALRAIGDIKGLIYVGVHDKAGGLLAELGATERLQSDLTMNETSGAIPLTALITTRSIEMSVPIVHAGVGVGRLQLVGDASDLAARLLTTLQTALAGLALSLVVAALIAWRMQRRITQPLRTLTAAMQRVSTSHDYSLSLKPSSIQEVGILIAGFNKMLFDIKARDAQLAASNAYLEEQVAERTMDLLEAKEAAETATMQKSDFLATMSHEIRTPMNGMLVMAELLVGAELPARARRYADVIARSGQSLLAIINDILDFSKIEAGKLELELVPVDLAEAAGTVMDLFCEKARGQGLDLAARVAVDLPTVIPGDPVRLNQILGNFINNALKFTASGGVRLDVERDPLSPNRIRFSVTDTGIGIPADKIETIFAAFSQADQSTTRRYGGTGLGLAICRKLVQAMGSEIRVTSEPGVGSCFSFSIAIPDDATDASWPRRDAAQTASPRIVLHVAGTFTARNAAYYIAQAGFAVVEADADTLLPRIEGATLALVDASACTPAVLLAAKRAGCRLVTLNEPGVVARDAAGGLIDAVLARPLSRRDIKEVLTALIAGTPITIGGAVDVADALPRFAGARALVADDNAVNREVASEALSRLGMVIDTVEDGAEALAAFQAKTYDIIFMDGSMPVLDGFDATRQIRAIEAETGGTPIPIIALTAHVIGTSSTEWIEAGMNALLHKPFTLKALAHCVSGLLSTEPARPDEDQPEAQPPVAPPADAMAEVPVIDDRTMSELKSFAASGRADFVTRVIGLYLNHAPQGARDIAAQAREGRLEAVAKSAHAVKSMSLNIGARRVAALASDIETQAKKQVLPDAAILDQLTHLIAEAAERLTTQIDPGPAAQADVKSVA